MGNAGNTPLEVVAHILTDVMPHFHSLTLRNVLRMRGVSMPTLIYHYFQHFFFFLVHCSSPMIFKNKSKLYLWRAAFLNYNGNYDISEFLIPGKHALMLLTWMIKPNEKQSHWKLRGIEIKYRWCCVIFSPKIHSSIKILNSIKWPFVPCSPLSITRTLYILHCFRSDRNCWTSVDCIVSLSNRGRLGAQNHFAIGVIALLNQIVWTVILLLGLFYRLTTMAFAILYEYGLH